MPICAIGEVKRHPDGKWYRKEAAVFNCNGCAYSGRRCPGVLSAGAIEDGDGECLGTIWVGPVDPPAAPEPAACPIQISEEEWAQAWHRIGPGRLAEVTEIRLGSAPSHGRRRRMGICAAARNLQSRRVRGK